MTAYAVLGPVRPEVPGPRVRALLARLALDPGRVVAREALVDALWGEEPPGDSANALQTLVSRLRRTLGAGAVTSHPAGYALAAAPDEVDAVRFERLVQRAGATSDDADARRTYAEALALWSGPPLAGLDAPFVDEAVRRLEDLRARAVEADAAHALRLGQAGEVLPALQALCAERPLRESAQALLVEALAAGGRQSEALATYEEIRRRLADELGVDPSPRLAAAHLAVLRGEVAAVAPPAVPASPRRHLRTYLTSFVGREDALRDVAAAVAGSRLVTVLGPGGMGKTRLSVEAAARHPGSRVRMVELASVAPGGDVLGAVIAALGLRETALIERAGPSTEAGDPVARLVEHLDGAESVLIVDNCEHLTAGAAQLVAELLAHCPGLRVLATSREPLGLTGEVVVPLAPLEPAAAVELLVERARAVRPGIELDPELASRVCQRLDAMPLAIELAAARLRGMSLEQLAQRLDDRFRLLRAGDPTVAERHRTLRGVIDWSWDLLEPPARRVLARLSVFAAPVSLEAAAHVCAGEDVDAADVPDLLAELAEQSLLVPGADGRYGVLETVREYAAGRLAESGELADARAAHLAHHLAFAEAEEPRLRTSAQRDALARLRGERDELLLALRHAEEAGDAGSAVRLAAAMAWMWTLLGAHTEATRELARALGVPGESPPGARAVALGLWAVSSSAATQGDTPREGWVEEVRQLAARVPEPERSPLLTLTEAMLAMVEDDNAGVLRATTEALERDLGDWERAALHLMQSFSAENSGDVATQRRALALAHEEFERLGDTWGRAMTMSLLASQAAREGRLGEALEQSKAGLHLLDELHADDDAAFLRVRVATLLAAQGDAEQARRWLEGVLERGASDLDGPSALVATHMLVELDLLDGDVAGAERRLRGTRGRYVHGAPGGPAQLRALMSGAEALVAAARGDGEAADRLMAEALETGEAARDMPVLADLAVLRASIVLDRGAPRDAMRVLGAGAAVRGTGDLGSLRAIRVREAATGLLGADAVEAAYAEGAALDRASALELVRSGGAQALRR